MLLLGAAVGCQAIEGLTSRKVDPLPAPGCALPSVGNGMIRLANFGAVGGGNADFCIRPSGSSGWGRPVFRDGGDDTLCNGGLQYTQVTVPFNVPAGQIDVKAIPAGQTCAANATSEVDQVIVGDLVNSGAPVVTIMRYGGGSSAESLSALPEEPNAKSLSGQKSYYRLVNATSGGKSIDMGQPATVTANNGASLPNTVTTPLYLPLPVPPGGVEPTGTDGNQLPIDASGYAQFIPARFNFAIAFDGDPKAIAIFQSNQSTDGDVASLYVIGDPTNNTFPVVGFYCEDLVSAGSLAGDAGAAGQDGGLTSQDYGLLAQCTQTKLPLLSIDSINVGLYGANAPFLSDRQPQIYKAIAARLQTDMMCIFEADDTLDRTQIIANAQGQFPYSYTITTDEGTQPTNPADQRPLPSTPPCSGVDISAAINCVNQNCSTVPNDPNMSGTLNETTNCIASQCAGPFVGFRSSTACFDCVLYKLSALETIASTNSDCTTDDHQAFAFGGETPVMMLSKYPFVPNSTQAYILPATGYRRAVLKAQVKLEDQVIDFFCAQVISPLIDGQLPYSGNFGKDNASTGENGWEDEQDLQTQEAVQWIKSQADADGNPAIIGGDWHSTSPCGSYLSDGGVFPTPPACPQSGLAPLSPEVIQAVDKRFGGPFDRADPAGWVESCDNCPSNVYNSASQAPQEYLPTFLYNFPASSTVAETIFWTDNSVTGIAGNSYSPAPPGGAGPLTVFYPHNVQVLRPPPKQ
jgi:hypothetical protein